MAIGKKKILIEIDRFLYDNTINGMLEKIQDNIKNNKATSDDNWIYLWQDYHYFGDLLKKLGAYEKKLKK